MKTWIKFTIIICAALLLTIAASPAIPEDLEVLFFGGAFIVLFILFRKKRLNPTNSDDQLKLVKKASFHQKKLMNNFEHRTYGILKKWVGARGVVFSQVNMGEILSTEDYSAFRSINSKRLDFLIITHEGNPFMAIECQGRGHYRGNAEVRDKVKAIALKSAGIPLIEVFENQSEQDIINSLNEALH